MNETEPSKETYELISKIKDNCAKEHLFIKLMNQKMESIEGTQQEILNKIDGLDEKLDKKYASKWVEKAITWFIVALVVSSLWFIFDAVGLPHF